MNSDKKATLLFAGDFCSRPSAKDIHIDDKIKSLILSSDMAVVNFEVPLKPERVSPIDGRLFQHRDSVEVLKGMGFSLFNICNNHIVDYGSKGVIETITTIGESFVMGVVRDNHLDVYRREVNGFNITFIPVCYDGYSTDERNDFYVNGISSIALRDTISEAKKESDFVIVLPHDGIEYIPIPTSYIRNLYHLFVDWGADAVIATHPHCVQGMEMYKKSPILYSIGNLFFNSKATVDFKTNLYGWYNGMIVELILDNTRIDVKYYFTENIGNKQLVMDDSLERVEHFKGLCYLLSDEEKYKSTENAIMEKLLYNKYLPAVDSLFRMQLRSKGLVYLLRQVYRAIRNIGCETRYLKFILKSNTERKFFVESLDKKL